MTESTQRGLLGSLRARSGWIVVVVVLLLAGLLPVLDDPALRSGAFVQDLRPQGATIGRIEPVPRALEAVVMDPSTGDLVARLEAPRRRRHTFRFEGLEPGKRYAYELRDTRGSRIDGGTFRTAAVDDGATVRFGVVGDSGRVPWWAWMQQSPAFHIPAARGWLPVLGPIAQVAGVLAEERPDWFLHVGDVIYPKGEHRFYGPAYFRPFAELLRHSAGYQVIGNHDFLPSGGRPLLRNFELPRNETAGDERCYTFADGPVRVIAVDNSWICIPRGEPARKAAKDAVYRYMRAQLGAATEPWIVFFQHYPLMTASTRPHRQSEEMRDEVLAILREFDVDLAFSGHDHNYQRFGDPGDRPIAIVSGGGGKSLYEELPEDMAGYAALHEAYHCCLVEVDGPRLTMRALDRSGAVLDGFTIDKKARYEAGELELDPSHPRDARTLSLVR